MDLAFFDRTARGRIIVTGRDRMDLLHRLATNSVENLAPGQGVNTCFCTNKGRLIDWSVILNRGDDLLILSGNPDRLSGHIQAFTITEDVTVRNYMAIEIVVCGPQAAGVLGIQAEPWCLVDTVIEGVKLQVARIEPLLGDGYSVLAPDAVALRRYLGARGIALDEAGVARLRVEQRIPAVPNEINEDHNPWEARLDDTISLTKGCYVGQEVIARLNTYDKVQRKLARLRLTRPVEPGDWLMKERREAAEITTISGEEALGYVEADYLEPGTLLDGAEVLG